MANGVQGGHGGNVIIKARRALITGSITSSAGSVESSSAFHYYSYIVKSIPGTISIEYAEGEIKGHISPSPSPATLCFDRYTKQLVPAPESPPFEGEYTKILKILAQPSL